MIKESKINLELKVPKDTRNSCTTYPGYSYSYEGEDLVKNHIFEATLHLEGVSRGRSSVKVNFYSPGFKYEMFISDFIPLVKEHCLVGGIHGYWTFRKKGSNYGLVKVIKDE